MNSSSLKNLPKKWMLLMLVMPSVAVAFIVGQATMYSRSTTLKGVRNVDTEMIESFIQSSFENRGEQTSTGKLGDAFQALVGRGNKMPYFGVAIWLNGNQTNSNHPLLTGKSIGDIRKIIADRDDPHSVCYVVKELEIDDESQKLELVFFRPELAHNMSPWNFLWLSFEQRADPYSPEVTWSKFIEKLPMIWFISGGLTMLVMIFCWFFLRWLYSSIVRRAAAKFEEARNEVKRLGNQILQDKALKAESDERLENAEKAIRKTQEELDVSRQNEEDLLSKADRNEAEVTTVTEERERAQAVALKAINNHDSVLRESKKVSETLSATQRDLTRSNEKYVRLKDFHETSNPQTESDAIGVD